jgi:malonyl-CoA O-methyltransferase
MNLPNKKNIGERFWKNKETYKQQATIQKELCACFATTLFSYNYTLHSIFEIGCGTGFLTEEIFKNSLPNTYFVNDISPKMKSEIDSIVKQYCIQNYTFLEGDAEVIEFPKQLDAIISTSTFQWFYDLPLFFKKVADSLQSEGVFAFSTFGPQNFIEIREVLGKGLEYITEQKLREYLEEDFTIVDCGQWEETLWFDSPKEVLQHIKNTGVSVFGGSYFGKENLIDFTNTYIHKYSEDSKVHLTYNPMMIIAKKK